MVKMTSVWDATTDFLRDHAAAVLTVSGALVFAPSLIGGLIDGAAASGAQTPGTAVTRGAASLIGTILTLWGGAAIAALAIRPSGAGPAIGQSARRLPAILGVTLVLLIAFLMLAIPLSAILAAGGVDMAMMAAPGTAMPAIGGGTAMALAAYSLFVLVLLLWAGARLAVLLPVIIAERRGLGAIRRASQLTRGHGWRLVGLYVLFGIVALVLSGAVGAVAGLIGVLLSSGTPGIDAGTVVVALAAAIVTTLLTVIQSAFVGRLYAALAPARDLTDTFA